MWIHYNDGSITKATVGAKLTEEKPDAAFEGACSPDSTIAFRNGAAQSFALAKANA